MAAIKALFKLKEAKDVLDELELAKINAKRVRQGLPPLEPPGWCDCITDPLKACFVEMFPCTCVTRNLPTPASLWKRMWFQGTIANKVTKVVTGFVCGVVLTMFMLYLFLVQFEVDLVPALSSSLLLATIIPFALAFSPRARCVTTLMFPSLFTALAAKVEDVLLEMEAFCDRTEQELEAMAANFDNIIDEMERIHGWYVRAKEFCNSGYADIANECHRDVDKVKENCAIKWHKKPFMKGLCKASLSAIKVGACKFFATGADRLCDIEFPEINLGIKERINRTIEEKKKQIRSYFWFDVKFHRNSSLEEVRSTNYSTILTNIKTELFLKVQFVSDLLRITQWMLFIFTSMVFIVAVWYLHKFHNVVHYDNHYITRFVEEMDAKRMAVHDNVESIFPLTWREELEYIYPGSIKITKREIVRIIANILLLLPILINLVMTAACDIGLWWILTLSNRVFSADYEEQVPGTFKMSIEGTGPLANVYKKIMGMSETVNERFNTEHFNDCIPYPNEPNWQKYSTLRNLCIYLVLIAILQGYILRLRNIICSWFYPERARERAAYMYNEVLQLRGNFSTYLKRQVRRATEEQANIERVSLCQRLGSGFPFLRPVLNALGYAQKYCLGCGLTGAKSDMESFVHCQNYGCVAVYCRACYEDLNNTCTSCMNPVDYGDFSDISEERDSSGDEEDMFPIARQAENESQKKIQRQGQLIAVLLKRQARQRAGGADDSSDSEDSDDSKSTSYTEGSEITTDSAWANEQIV